MTARIMIVDDEKPIRDSLQGLFEDEEYLVVCAASGEEAIARLRKQPVDCVLLDIWMPGIDGLETLNRIHLMDANLPVIMMSGHATIDTAVRATRQGAFDFVEKPVSFDRLMILARNAVQKRSLEQENRELKLQETSHHNQQELIGNSDAISEVKTLIKRVALSDAPVLILGEHGTGKDVAARMLHAASKRKGSPFIAVNTASIPVARMDSELFGHEKGAFTGALHAQRGRFEAAHQGVLFFDEITELSMAVQAKVLHVLQARVVQRLGNPSLIDCNVRLIAASARDLDLALQQEKIREDFYYRLNVVSIHMPSLRNRLDDLPALIRALAEEQAGELGGEAVRFDEDVITRLKSYAWPGNVRELRNYIERCHILMPGEQMSISNMLPPGQSSTLQSSTLQSSTLQSSTLQSSALQSSALQSSTLQSSVRQSAVGSATEGNLSALSMNDNDSFHNAREIFERSFLLQHLNKHKWNISRTATEIGMERSQLHRKIKAFSLVQHNGEKS